MGLLNLFLTLALLPCLTFAAVADRNTVMRYTNLDQFRPPKPGCVVNLIVEAFSTCPWCDDIGNQLSGMLARNYVPTLDFSPQSLVTKNQYQENDFKGTCHVNWLIVDDFISLRQIFSPLQLSRIRTKTWFVFVKGERQSAFLKCWKAIIDEKFGFIFPRAALIMMHNARDPNFPNPHALHKITTTYGQCFETVDANGATFRMASSCYMCHGSDHYFIPIENDDPRNLWDIVENAGDKIGINGPPDTSMEADYFNSGRPDPHPEMDEDFFWNTLLSAAQIHLNYTFDERGLISYTVWSNKESPIEELGSSPVKSVFLTKRGRSLVYCRSLDTNKYFTALLSPYDSTTWILLLVSLVLISLVPGIGFRRGFNVIWLMLGQQPQGRRIGLFIVLSINVFFPFVVIYKEYFASNAMIPFEKEYLNTNQKVFNAGFRYICEDDVEECVKFAEQIFSSKNMGVDFKDVEKYFLGNEIGLEPGKYRDRGTYPKEIRRKEYILLEQESFNPGTKCYMVAEYWNVQTVSLQFTGPLSEVMYETLRTFRQAGLVNFWYNIPIQRELWRLKQELAATAVEDDGGMGHMNSTLVSLFRIFFGMSGMVILCLTAEILTPKIVARWRRWRERRRYLRAIWPLGRI